MYSFSYFEPVCCSMSSSNCCLELDLYQACINVLSRIHCPYTILSTEFKGKHNLEQDELFCCALIRSGLKEKKKFVLFSSLRVPDPFLLLGDPRLLTNLPRHWLSHIRMMTPRNEQKFYIIAFNKIERDIRQVIEH